MPFLMYLSVALPIICYLVDHAKQLDSNNPDF